MRKKIIVLGSGNSGSGAIYDYLAGRDDISKPLDKEFRLIQDPGGLVDLHKAYSLGYKPERFSQTVNEFIDFCNRCGRTNRLYGNWINARYGNGYKLLLANYYQKIDRYISSISKRLSESERSSKMFRIGREIKKRLNGKKLDQGMFLPIVDESDFLHKTEVFLDHLLEPKKLLNDNNFSGIVIDQGGSFWEPESSSVYYGENRKIIVVFRDPRGVFNSFKTKGLAYPGNDINLFCDWYRGVMNHINHDEWKSEKVLQVSYESFVLNFKSEKVKLDNFLEIDPEIATSADMKRSAYNARKYEQLLSRKENDFIRSVLGEFVNDY